MKDILLLNTSVFIMLILGFISLLFGLQGDYIIAFAILIFTVFLDYYDYFLTKKSYEDTPLKWELKLITRFVNFSLVPIVISFIYFKLINLTFLVYIPLILYIVATSLDTAFNMQLMEEQSKLPNINKSAIALILFLAILYNSRELWFLYLAVVLSLSYLIIKDISKRARN